MHGIDFAVSVALFFTLSLLILVYSIPHLASSSYCSKDVAFSIVESEIERASVEKVIYYASINKEVNYTCLFSFFEAPEKPNAISFESYVFVPFLGSREFVLVEGVDSTCTFESDVEIGSTTAKNKYIELSFNGTHVALENPDYLLEPFKIAENPSYTSFSLGYKLEDGSLLYLHLNAPVFSIVFPEKREIAMYFKNFTNVDARDTFVLLYNTTTEKAMIRAFNGTLSVERSSNITVIINASRIDVAFFSNAESYENVSCSITQGFRAKTLPLPFVPAEYGIVVDGRYYGSDIPLSSNVYIKPYEVLTLNGCTVERKRVRLVAWC